jgi:hypothetical protein
MALLSICFINQIIIGHNHVPPPGLNRCLIYCQANIQWIIQICNKKILLEELSDLTNHFYRTLLKPPWVFPSNTKPYSIARASRILSTRTLHHHNLSHPKGTICIALHNLFNTSNFNGCQDLAQKDLCLGHLSHKNHAARPAHNRP